jgi:hypothetical protein
MASVHVSGSDPLREVDGGLGEVGRRGDGGVITPAIGRQLTEQLRKGT